MAVTLVRRYVQSAALRAFALVAAALTGLFSLLQFVAELACAGQGHYRVGDAFLYVLLTAPSRLLQVTPVSLLLGSLLALDPLGRNSELTAMLSLGISRNRIIGMVLELTVPIVAVLLLLSEFVVPPSQQLAQSQRTSALSSASSFHSDNSLWAEGNHQYLNVREFERGNVPIGIDIYSFADDGSLRSLIHADRAGIRPDGTWRLAGVTRRQVHGFDIRTDHLPFLPWHSFLPARQVRFLILPLDSVPPVALFRYVHHLKRGDFQAGRYGRELWTRIGIPFSMVAMVMISTPLVFGPTRMQTAGQSIARGVGIGLVFSLGQQIVGRLGLLLDASPAITALFPPLLVIALAIHLLRRSDAGG